MPQAAIPANRVMAGTWGQVWVDNELWAELSGFQAKFTYNKSPVNICGAMAEDSKVTSVKGTGSIEVAKNCVPTESPFSCWRAGLIRTADR